MDFNLKYYENIYKKENFSKNGLDDFSVKKSSEQYGNNTIKKTSKKSLLKRILNALYEPMIIILLFAWIITFAVNITNFLSGKQADFYECIGIFLSISVSVGLTVIMENKSEKAFELLEKYSSNTSVKVLRNNKVTVIDCAKVVVGDVIIYESGDKIVADGLIFESIDLETEEATLNGEIQPINKIHFKSGAFKAENMLFSGTYVKCGFAKCIVLAVGENAQTGKIAINLQTDNSISTPLNEKLNNLSKKISIFGAISAVAVFILNIVRHFLLNTLTFSAIKDAFIESIILIVAAVPEGLPATVAISLALSVVKLAKSNAIIKKLVATETVGCISVICSDKTGTLTTGNMQVHSYETSSGAFAPNKLSNVNIRLNIALNSTAVFVNENGKEICKGNYTEQALLNSLFINKKESLEKIRKENKIINRSPFSSVKKYMSTTVLLEDGKVLTYYKGSFEQIAQICKLTPIEYDKINSQIQKYQKNAERILAFAHENANQLVFDGYCRIFDEIRPEVINSVASCKKAGIEVKILTGDNKDTALSVAKKLSLLHSESNCLTGCEIENMSDEALLQKLPQISVVSRSTPETKLRIVKLLKQSGKVVAVTGDGVNLSLIHI